MKILIKWGVLLILGVWLSTVIWLKFAPHNYAQVSAEQESAARAYLEDNLTPPPADWQWQMYTAAPGVQLRSGKLPREDNLGTVIVVPGFTATMELHMREIQFFRDAGYQVAALEYRGQGGSYRPLSNPEKGYVEDYTQLATELAAFANSQKQADKPLFFYSISKGAHITMRMAADFDPGVTAYALMVPMIEVNTGEFKKDRLLAITGIADSLGLGTLYAPGSSNFKPGPLGVAGRCNSNPRTAQTQDALYILQPELRTRGVTLKWLRETLKSSAILTKEHTLEKITQPVKVYTAGIDRLVDTQAAQDFCTALSDCSLKHIPSARHCIAREDYALYDSLLVDALQHFNRHNPIAR